MGDGNTASHIKCLFRLWIVPTANCFAIFAGMQKIPAKISRPERDRPLCSEVCQTSPTPPPYRNEKKQQKIQTARHSSSS